MAVDIDISISCKHCHLPLYRKIKEKHTKDPLNLLKYAFLQYAEKKPECVNGEHEIIIDPPYGTDEIPQSILSIVYDTKGFKPKPWSDAIMEKHHFATLEDTEEVFVYQEGVYVPGAPLIKAKAEKLLGDKATTHNVNEIVFNLTIRNYTRRDAFDRDIDIINLENGLLNIITGELRSHTPDYLSLVRIPVIYAPDANCPRIKKFLSEVLHEDDIPLIQEMAGYCLYRTYDFQKAFMMLGPGGNGKSKLLGLIEAVLGKDNTSNVPLQELGENKFSREHLFKKLANICADIPPRKILNSGVFKMLTGGDRVYAEKKFKNPFSFENHAKLIFSANKLPPVADDDSDAFFRRWIIINFPNTFEGEKADKKILEKLTTPEELSGFLNWALEGLRRLLDNGGFSNGLSTDQVRKEYIRKSDPVAAFLMDCTDIDSEAEIAKDELYNAYVDYCHKKKLPTVSKISFARDELPQKVRNLRAVKRGPKGKQYKAWKGLKLANRDQGKTGNRDGITDGMLDDFGIRDTGKNRDQKTPKKGIGITGITDDSLLIAGARSNSSENDENKGVVNKGVKCIRNTHDTPVFDEEIVEEKSLSEHVQELLEKHPDYTLGDVRAALDVPTADEAREIERAYHKLQAMKKELEALKGHEGGPQ